jgi:hypothetical protein
MVLFNNPSKRFNHTGLTATCLAIKTAGKSPRVHFLWAPAIATRSERLSRLVLHPLRHRCRRCLAMRNPNSLERRLLLPSTYRSLPKRRIPNRLRLHYLRSRSRRPRHSPGTEDESGGQAKKKPPDTSAWRFEIKTDGCLPATR